MRGMELLNLWLSQMNDYQQGVPDHRYYYFFTKKISVCLNQCGIFLMISAILYLIYNFAMPKFS